MKLVAIFIFTTFFSISLFAFDFESYSDNTINGVIGEYNRMFSEYHKNEPDVKISNSITPLMPNRLMKIRAKVLFSGKMLKIRSSEKEIIAAWDRMVGTNYSQYYNYEIEVIENNAKYLLPIQDQLLSSFKNEIRPGDELYCYLVLMGNFKDNYLIVMTEFGSISNKQ